MPVSVNRLGITFILLGLSLLNQAAAQDISEWYALYRNKNFSALRQEIEQQTDSSGRNDELRFFKTLFLENGDDAFAIYEQLYPRSSGTLRTCLGEKLAQYYYARGFYVRAAEFGGNDSKSMTIDESAVSRSVKGTGPAEGKKVNFIIQVGAFSQEPNARHLQDGLRAQKIESQIVTRVVNGRNLYCVWVNGEHSLEATLKTADNIKERFQVEYRILEN